MAASKKLAVRRTTLDKLCRADPALVQVLDSVGLPGLRYGAASCALESLVRSIIFQQLSGKAAGTIYGRFKALFETDGFPEAALIVKQHHARLRKAGVSRQKQAAIKDLCRHVISGRLPLDNLKDDLKDDLKSLDDEALIERLTAVRGIGRWSAQMFMMFHLGRRDVWPVDDLGVRKGVQRLRGLAELPTPKAMVALGEVYEPHRSIVAWYMWRWLDGPGEG